MNPMIAGDDLQMVDYFVFCSPTLGLMAALQARKTSVVRCKVCSRNMPSGTTAFRLSRSLFCGPFAANGL